MKKYICKNCWILNNSEVSKEGYCKKCWKRTVKIWGDYAERLDDFQAGYQANRALKEDYQELFRTSVEELKFRNNQVENLNNVIYKIKELLDQNIAPKLIKKIIENKEEEYILDMSVHNAIISRDL